MRRLALVTLVATLALPGGALGRTFSGRVVRTSANAVTLRLAGGKVVRYEHPRVASAVAGQPLLAHAAREAAALMTFSIGALDPGVAVLVTKTPRGVTIALPGPGAAEQRAVGVVTDVHQGTFELRLADRTQLRVHGRGVHRCEVASVAYHQDVVVLVADRVRLARGHRANCTVSRGGAQARHVQRVARGTVTAASNGTVTIIDSATGRRETFVTPATPAVGDRVAIVYRLDSGHAVADALYAQAG